MNQQRAVVTGGGGFLGSRIVSMLLDAGYSVTSFSRGQYPALRARGVSCRVGDLADASAVRQACDGADVVFHIAAKAGLWGRYADYYRANVEGTRNVVEACRRNGVSKLVYTSTPSVVLSGRDLRNAREDVPFPKRYCAHYARTKAEAERVVLAANGADLATVALRPHIIWGPGDTQLLPRLVARHAAKRLMIVGKGDNLVDTTFVDNAARAHLAAAERLHPGSAVAGRVYFISQGDPRPIKRMMNDLLRAAGQPAVEQSIPVPVARGAAWLIEAFYRLFDVAAEPPLTRFLVMQFSSDHYFDISAARRDLGYEPSISIEAGLETCRMSMALEREAAAATHAGGATTTAVLGA